MTELLLDWESIRADRADCDLSLEFPTRILADAETSSGPLRYGIGVDNGLLLLIPCEGDLLRKEMPKGSGLDIQVRTYVVSGRNKIFLEVRCTDNDLETAFKLLIENVVGRIKSGSGPLNAVGDAIGEFRELIQVLKFGIDASKAAGLLGELLSLGDLLTVDIDLLAGWRGPDSGRHDFARGRFAVEAKATQASGAAIVTINGIRQLEPPDDGQLIIAFYRLDQVDGGSLSLSRVVRELAKQLDSALFRERLETAGYNSITEHLWNQWSWELVERRLYRVDDGFPKLTNAELNSGLLGGVQAVTYKLNLDVAGDFLIELDEVAELAKAVEAD